MESARLANPAAPPEPPTTNETRQETELGGGARHRPAGAGQRRQPHAGPGARGHAGQPLRRLGCNRRLQRGHHRATRALRPAHCRTRQQRHHPGAERGGGARWPTRTVAPLCGAAERGHRVAGAAGALAGALRAAGGRAFRRRWSGTADLRAGDVAAAPDGAGADFSRLVQSLRRCALCAAALRLAGLRRRGLQRRYRAGDVGAGAAAAADRQPERQHCQLGTGAAAGGHHGGGAGLAGRRAVAVGAAAARPVAGAHRPAPRLAASGAAPDCAALHAGDVLPAAGHAGHPQLQLQPGHAQPAGRGRAGLHGLGHDADTVSAGPGGDRHQPRHPAHALAPGGPDDRSGPEPPSATPWAWACAWPPR